MSRVLFFNELGARRQGLVNQHSTEARVLFETIENIPKGILICLALSHGLDIKVGDRILTSEALRVKIYAHVGTGQCKRREGQVSHLGCSSIDAQLDPSTSDFEQEDPSKRMEIQILKQLAQFSRPGLLDDYLNSMMFPIRNQTSLRNCENVSSPFCIILLRGSPCLGSLLELVARKERETKLVYAHSGPN
ncbi:hypothetical protein B0H13DRAFT_1898719 [Mycena leptocephala]|jgi:hypothetical protein|nr:hypothetical protein B0H13DRAFT_1898719 [Mycena leptocephala]